MSILSVAASDASIAEQGQCLVDSGEAVSDIMDASLFMWAASKRCGKKAEEAKCAVDVSAAIKSVNSMANVILKAVDKCGALNTENKKCGFAASTLSEHTAGLSAAGAVISQKCGKDLTSNVNLGAIASPVMCTVDLKNTAKSLFKGVREILKLKGECEEGQKKCALNALDVAAALTGMGDYLAGAVGQCERTTAITGTGANNAKNTREALCAQGALDVVHHTSKVASAAVELSRACAVGNARLYSQFDKEEKKEKKKNGLSTSLILGAFLPVTAVIGFAGGRFVANRQTEQVRDFMSDNE